MKAVCIIPARYDSKRFPGKPLAPLAGKPMIRHVYERAREAGSLERVVVATDDRRIARCVAEFGGEVIMTGAHHPSGTDRVAEAATDLVADVIVNLQGDEPLIEPGAIDQVVGIIAGDPGADMATLMSPINDLSELEDPNVVKVVTDTRGYALYFSRAGLPFVRDGGPLGAGRHYRHVGIYAYRKACLTVLAASSPTPLEMAEKLEQLRALELGMRIKVEATSYRSLGVDTPDDLKRAEALLTALKG